MQIENATADDAAQILELQKIAYQSEAELYNDYTIPPLTETLEELKTLFENHIFLKATVEGKIVGSVRACNKGNGTCHIGRLIVAPDFQNRGVGTLLLAEIERRFAGCSRFELFTGAKSDRNIHLYQKAGYKQFKTMAVSDKLKLTCLEKVNKK